MSKAREIRVKYMRGKPLSVERQARREEIISSIEKLTGKARAVDVKKMKQKQNYVVVSGGGIPCPRCGHPTQIREHEHITDKMRLKQPYYYKRWFYCLQASCKTSMVMRDEYKVYQPSLNAGEVTWGESWDDVDAANAAITAPKTPETEDEKIDHVFLVGGFIPSEPLNFVVVYDRKGNPITVGRLFPRDRLEPWIRAALASGEFNRRKPPKSR